MSYKMFFCFVMLNTKTFFKQLQYRTNMAITQLINEKHCYLVETLSIDRDCNSIIAVVKQHFPTVCFAACSCIF